jgi:hypothetical protein
MAIFDELVAEGSRAIDTALSAMPQKFPEELASSIVRGFLRRLASVADATRKKA